MFKSTAVKTMNEKAKMNFCLYLDKFHCLFLCLLLPLKQRKVFFFFFLWRTIYQSTFWAHLTMSFLYSAMVEPNKKEWKKKWKSVEIHKSSCDGSRFSFGGEKYQITILLLDERSGEFFDINSWKCRKTKNFHKVSSFLITNN